MSIDSDLILKNATTPDGLTADISIKDGLVVHRGSSQRAENIIDCSGYLCLLGAVDMHVHMRGGTKHSYKETWESGSKSAIAGGITTVVDQPNTIPPVKDAVSFNERVNEAKRDSYCNFGINGGVFPGCRTDEMFRAGALAFGEIFFAESSYGSAVDSEFLAKAFTELSKTGLPATIHAESVLPGNDDSLICHEKLRTEKGEAKAVNSVLEIAPPDLKLHFCHLSSPESIEAAADRKNVTFEVMPHHLFLSTEMFEEKNGRGKVNPPLRHEKVRKELWTKWDKIDVIASDHAPHTLMEKTGCEFSSVPSGIPGVETMIPLLMPMVFEKKITLSSLIEKTVTKPSEILGINAPGYTKGCRADFALYPHEVSEINAENLHSKAGWTPYEGMKASFPDIVVSNGSIAFKNNEFFKAPCLWFKGNGYIENNYE